MQSIGINYHFNIDEAQMFGVNEAIFISNLRYWIFQNKAENKNFHDGRTWSYNSQIAFTVLFPFWSVRSIRTITSKLIKEGIIMTGNYHADPYNRSLWYAFVDEEKALKTGFRLVENDKSVEMRPVEDIQSSNPTSHYMCQDRQMDESITTDVITNNKQTNIKQKIKNKHMSSCKKLDAEEVKEIFEFWQQTLNHPRASLDKKRKGKITMALTHKTKEELKQAVLGCSMSPHHMGDNTQGTLYDDIELIMRDASHIERFIKIYHLAEKKNSPEGKAEEEKEKFYAELRKDCERHKKLMGCAI